MPYHIDWPVFMFLWPMNVNIDMCCMSSAGVDRKQNCSSGRRFLLCGSFVMGTAAQCGGGASAVRTKVDAVPTHVVGQKQSIFGTAE